jgi:hypothetical protein
MDNSAVTVESEDGSSLFEQALDSSYKAPRTEVNYADLLNQLSLSVHKRATHNKDGINASN